MPSPEARRAVAGVPDVPASEAPAGFRVALSSFEGPFDLLLTLITRRELDVTEISLSRVTDEFIAYLRGITTEEDLEAASGFLVVAATLLDLKIAGLLPAGEPVDAEDVALLEARDLLFARLLQYRAFKEIAAWFAERLAAEAGRHPRSVRLEERFRARTPPLAWSTSADDLAALARLAFAPREVPSVGLEHLHAPLVSIREQAGHIAAVLADGVPRSFRELVADALERGVVVARFLAVLELYRRALVDFDQSEPLGDLTVAWTGGPAGDLELSELGVDYDG